MGNQILTLSLAELREVIRLVGKDPALTTVARIKSGELVIPPTGETCKLASL